MERIRNIYVNIKPVFHTILFEVKLQKRKFIIFSIITVLLIVFYSVIPYILIPYSYLPSSEVGFYQFGLVYFITIVILTTSFFFSGIICSEYKKKTGLTLLPLINKNKIIIGKYIANYILVLAIVVVQYSLIALLSYYFYGESLLLRLFLSFGYAALYILALASVTTFLSSFMPSAPPVIIIVIAFILFGFPIIDSLLVSINYEFEPMYSLTYLYNIIRYIIFPEFSTKDRFYDYTYGNITYRTWLFPSAEGALIALTIYAIIFFLLGIILFKRRQL